MQKDIQEYVGSRDVQEKRLIVNLITRYTFIVFHVNVQIIDKIMYDVSNHKLD